MMKITKWKSLLWKCGDLRVVSVIDHSSESVICFHDNATNVSYYWDMKLTKYGICEPPLGYSLITEDLLMCYFDGFNYSNKLDRGCTYEVIDSPDLQYIMENSHGNLNDLRHFLICTDDISLSILSRFEPHIRKNQQ